jgi:ABC-type lipoprotein export system ATPase subunit
MLGARAGHTSAWFPFSPSCRKFSNDAIESVGIYSKLRTPVRKLSGGQQRRVAVARTLAQQPRLILADEFLAELDEETLEMVMKVVLDYVAENNAIMILVEHDFERAKRMASRLFTAQDGTLVEIYDF